MQVDFLTRVKSKYNQFTKAEKKVADYILQNSNEVLFLSITDLAEACAVGDTSVFRFCKTMGLKGYQEFKMKLSLSLKEVGDEKNRITGNVGREDDLREVAQKVYHINLNALEETYSLFNENEFNRAIELLGGARKICFFGVGASMLTAMKAMNKFLRIMPNVYCIQDAHMQAMQASTMKKGDVAVLFSYSGATKDTLHVAELVHEAGAKMICITRFVKSPMTSFADITLLYGANESPLQGGSASVEISQMFMIDLLYTECYRRYFEQCNRNNERTASSVVEKLC